MALALRKASGRPRTLTAAQERQVFRRINGKDPRQYGFDFALWTRKVVGELIEREFGVQLGVTAVGKLLAQLGLTPQKPLQRALPARSGSDCPLATRDLSPVGQGRQGPWRRHLLLG
jgi:transposase